MVANQLEEARDKGGYDAYIHIPGKAFVLPSPYEK